MDIRVVVPMVSQARPARHKLMTALRTLVKMVVSVLMELRNIAADAQQDFQEKIVLLMMTIVRTTSAATEHHV